MALSHAIMTALIEDDLSGYELAKAFDASLGFFWHASHQQIYRECRKLTELGWVERRPVPQRGRPDKFLYALTEPGRHALEHWVAEPSRVQAAKDDLLVKLYNLSEDNAPLLAAQLTARREEMMQRLFLYERIRRSHYADPGQLPTRRRGVYLALVAGIRFGEQFLAWCDEALEMLASLDGR